MRIRIRHCTFVAGLLCSLTFAPLLKAQQSEFRAGAATSDITLPLGASNGGVIARGGPVTRIHDRLHARCLVLDDGKTRIAFLICDLRMIGRDVIDHAKEIIQKETKMSPDNVLIAATHTHAAPAVIGIHTSDRDRAYARFLAQRTAAAVQKAIRNLKPARIGWGFADVPKHVHNRRWHMKDGTVPANPFGLKTDRVRMNPPSGSDALIKPAGPVDQQLAVLSVQHADGSPLALLGNYSLHYVGGYQSGHVSADYFGIFSERIAELFAKNGASAKSEVHPPFVAMMSNGTSGDVNNIDFRKAAKRLPPWVKMKQVADDLAAKAAQVFRSIKHRDDISLDVAVAELQLGIRRPNTKRLQWAEKITATVQKNKRLSRPQIYAGEAIALAKFPMKVPVKLQAIRIGPLKIAAIPCEVFAETGLALKKHSVGLPMFTIELANGYNGYLPTAAQHKLGGYETWPARSSYLEVQAETKIRSAVMSLLTKLSVPDQKPRGFGHTKQASQSFP